MFMHSLSLYIWAVLIWGSTWFAIKFQLGVVAPEVSLVYRFSMAAIILFIFCLATKRSLKYNLTQHAFIASQGLFLFSTNYLIFYWATGLLTSGIVAVLFSTVILMNIVNGAIFRKAKVSLRVVIGAMVGIAGIAGIFWSEVAAVDNDADTWSGLWMCLFATLLASFGNILSARNQHHKIPVIQTNAIGMAYGSLIMILFALFNGASFIYENTWEYSVSLVYLALFGSVLAFGSYLTLVGRIGADKASYSAVMFPVIALGLSTVFESYEWTLLAVFGFVLILFGNYLVLTKGKSASSY